VTSAIVDRFHLTFHTNVGSAIDFGVDTTVRDLPTLRTLIRQVEAHAAPSLRLEDAPEELDAAWRVSAGPQTYLPVSLWHPATYEALVTSNQEITASLVRAMQPSGYTCAATIMIVGQAALCFHPLGKIAWGEDTDSEVTASVHTADGKASGWSGQASRNWAVLHPERVIADAIDMAARGRNPVRVEPGRYTAILGSAAVGALFGEGMCSQFNFEDAGPLRHWPPLNGKLTKFNERVADSRLTIWSDPTDPNFGSYPFFDDGTPSGKVTWVDKGVLKALSYDPGTAMQMGVTPVRQPPSFQMSGGTTSIADMIANCERGIYVHRISPFPTIMDWRSAMALGNTRDGCFFIKNGKITSSVINFRFEESPFLMINKILALGVPERVAFGTVRLYRMDGLPLLPIVVPPMMVQDFNFSALCDAV